VLDSSVDPKTSEDVRAIVTQILDIAPARGDTLAIVHSPFTPLWRTIWHEPEMAGLLVKYILIGFLSIMTLGVVAVSLLKLSDAMREMATAQKYSMTMDLGDKGGPGASEAAALEDGGAPAALPGPERPPQAAAGEAAEVVRFSVRPDQVEALADMLRNESPDNIALVGEHLEADIWDRLLKALPGEAADRVLASLGKVRYVEPDVILNLKDELERRLAGAVGGLSRVIAMLEAADMTERRRLMESITAQDPELGVALRGRVFLLDSLAYLTKEEWSVLSVRLTYEDWAQALSDGPQTAVDALVASVPEAAGKVLSQMIAAKPGDEASRRAAQDKVAKAVAALVAEGRIGNPSGREPQRLQQDAVKS
jgi:hypothetical protein